MRWPKETSSGHQLKHESVFCVSALENNLVNRLFVNDLPLNGLSENNSFVLDADGLAVVLADNASCLMVGLLEYNGGEYQAAALCSIVLSFKLMKISSPPSLLPRLLLAL